MKSTDEKMAFAREIDFQRLFRHAELVSGTVLTFTEPSIYERRGDVYVAFESNDIRSACGVFGIILRRCVIKPFSGGIYEDKETGELGYWANMNLQYQHHDGGSNGMDLFNAWYKDGKWEFKNIEPRNV